MLKQQLTKLVNNRDAANLSDMLYQLYAIIWSRNGVGLTCMGPYWHMNGVDSVSTAHSDNLDVQILLRRSQAYLTLASAVL